MKIYLAGKVTDASWRVECERRLVALPPAGWAPVFDPEFPVVPLGIGDHMMTGPFFINCGHSEIGCYRMQENGHGMGADDCGCGGSDTSRSNVVRMCLNAIERSDVLFAWIDQDSCYGTLAEIGYAKALGKIVWIAGPSQYVRVGPDDNHGENPISDLWFACSMADELIEAWGGMDAIDALKQFISYGVVIPIRQRRRAAILSKLRV